MAIQASSTGVAMNDKELLELAAKAAGIELKWMTQIGNDVKPDEDFISNWHPLTDDGDALRLAVKLNITVGPERPDVIGKSLCRVSWLERTRSLGEYGDGCPYAATRRAIVRAAAEIGKTL